MIRDTNVSRNDSTAVHEEKQELEMQCVQEGKVNRPRAKRTAAANAGGEDSQPLEKKLKPGGHKAQIEMCMEATKYEENLPPALVKKFLMMHTKIEGPPPGLQLNIEHRGRFR